MADDDKPIELPPNVSPLRFMIASASGAEHRRHETLDAARSAANSIVVMEGDSGGQIYLSCPVRIVKCDSPTLTQLLSDLDDLQWSDSTSTGLYFEVPAAGVDYIPGGMGGGRVTAGVWLHPELEHLRSQVEEVIAGSKPRIDARPTDE